MKPIPRFSGFFTAVYSAALLLLAGCGRSGAAPAPKTPSPATQVVSQPILQLFKAHGIDCREKGDWLEFPNRSIKASGVIVEESNHEPDTHSVQLDFQMELDSGENLTESFAGIGESRDKAIKDAVDNFALNSFPVIMAAFFTPQDNPVKIKNVRIENWSIEGTERRVVIGPIGMQGKAPDSSNTPLDWFKQIEEKLKSTHLFAGTHWISIYYGQIDNHPLKLEVLVNNEVWEQMQKELATIDWPKGKKSFSLLVFMVIHNKSN